MIHSATTKELECAWEVIRHIFVALNVLLAEERIVLVADRQLICHSADFSPPKRTQPDFFPVAAARPRPIVCLELKSLISCSTLGALKEMSDQQIEPGVRICQELVVAMDFPQPYWENPWATLASDRYAQCIEQVGLTGAPFFVATDMARVGLYKVEVGQRGQANLSITDVPLVEHFLRLPEDPSPCGWFWEVFCCFVTDQCPDDSGLCAI